MNANDREISAGLELIDSLDHRGGQMADIGQQLISCIRKITGGGLIGESAKGVASLEVTINGIAQAVRDTNQQVVNHLESTWTPR
ncbi:MULTISPECIES: hypothetical protein [Mycobacteroides]|uniref:Uncharacterized protein n=1 Tax=Mycobacteroides immunogenum TaxID=83262 RepID=A0ABR5LM46_9MYCO|nr:MULTISPECIES: hypothetical protein [Mycobacteroides]AKP58810.1 hypothetical protein MAUC22_15430 [Mycobacteroides abscessus UC22]KPG28056.1 hypothetical protein AN912_22255 [Mycobacteroides immunogenum]KPG28748.1 hypothetical protein AN913_12485 [Mycobacteroides immunogenum]KPG60307.1 hypothetical protein AN918_11465 [Mycobacteroides immunogenum]MBE5465059.1 hypothetical protein [Mycobacteroides abscessus]